MLGIRVAACLLFALTSLAQPISPAERRQFGEILPPLLETLYVIPEKGKQLAAQMRASFESGKYDDAATATALADAINADLRAANDRHLGMRVNTAQASAPVLTVDAWSARRAAMAGGGPRMGRGYDRDAIRRVNFGVLGAEVLDGNAGYLRMREFMDTDETRAAIDNAMAFIAHTDAVIVDVRNCPGGNADTVSYLASYFFPAERRVLMNRYNRPMNRSMQSTTVDVTGKRRPDTPLYVLTAGTSASACESFAFTLQQWGRAKTVGEKTAGAGNNNMIVDVGRGLQFSISVGSATHPKTGKGFEAVGVQPDIAAPADRALETALAACRSGFSPTAAATVGLKPDLHEYAGTYGVREISVRDGVLYYQRVGARGGVLKPLARDQFDLNGDVIVTFNRGSGGAVESLEIRWKDGRTETAARTN